MKWLLLITPIFLYYLTAAFLNAAEYQGLTIVTQNLNRFFDDKDDGNSEKIISHNKYQQRLNQLAGKINRVYQFADVMAFQEVENIHILQDISQHLLSRFNVHYRPVLIEGNDPSGIDVGFLVRDSYQINNIRALYSHQSYNKNADKLFSRPPLVIEVCQTTCFTIMNLHLRSMRGLRSSRKGKRVIKKRRLQAEAVAKWIQKLQQSKPELQLIVTGDFNALRPSDAYVDIVGTIQGNPDQDIPGWKSPDLIKHDLIDLTRRIQPKFRYSYLYKGKKQLLDYFLVSRNLTDQIRSLKFTEIDYSFSDHAAVIAEFKY